MFACEEAFKQVEFPQNLERRRVNRVAPKIAQEVFVLFQDDYFHSDASKQKPKHHPGRAAADNATASPELLHRLTVFVHRGCEDHRLLQRRWEINRTAEEAGELESHLRPGFVDIRPTPLFQSSP